MSKKSGTTKKDEDNIPTLRETIQSVNAYLKEKMKRQSHHRRKSSFEAF